MYICFLLQQKIIKFKIKMPTILSKFTDVQCDIVGHTWDKRCMHSSFHIFINCMKYALSVYTPLYTVSLFFTWTPYFIVYFFYQGYILYYIVFLGQCITESKRQEVFHEEAALGNCSIKFISFMQWICYGIFLLSFKVI